MRFCEGKFVELSGVHHTVLRQAVNDGFHKADLVGTEMAALQVGRKGLSGGVSVESNQFANKEFEA